MINLKNFYAMSGWKWYFVTFFLVLWIGGFQPQKGVCVSDTQPLRESKKPEEILPNPKIYFRITVVDQDTGRGIPLVKLATITGVDYYTDSAGVIAFFEPGLMNREVYFYIESHGYSIEKDPFDGYGKIIKVVPGGSEVIKMKRENIAQRLYRITGSGIYHDSILLGDKVPIKQPIINSSVVGQDSTLVSIYKGGLFWIWGDTSHPRHPLAANFKVTCGTSKLPEDGGLDPEIGVDQNYFKEGEFVKSMMPIPGANPYWLGSLLTVKNKSGEEKLLANYSKIKPLMETIERGKVQFNDEKQVFEIIKQYPLDDIVQPNGHPYKVTENGIEYFYFFSDGVCRTKNDYDSIIDHTSYETFTCLKEGSRFDCKKEQIERWQDGSLKFSWKKNTSPVGQKEQEKLIKASLINPDEKWFQLIDINTGKEIVFHGGSIYLNPYRNRWVMIALEAYGTSFLGEVWYAEGDTPVGPFAFAQKIVTHNKYSFYNPVQHPHFAKDNGRVIFFEGTYSTMFSGNDIPTPRYEYNQIMYKLELDDKRLFLPVPIYRAQEGEITRYLTREKIPKTETKPEIVFYAPDRPRDGTIPIYEVYDKVTNQIILTLRKPESSMNGGLKIAFYGLKDEVNPPPLTLLLFEYIHSKSNARIYSTEETLKDSDYKRSENPVCRVWKNPTKFNPFI